MSHKDLNTLRRSIGDHNYSKLSTARPGPKDLTSSQRDELTARKQVSDSIYVVPKRTFYVHLHHIIWEE